MGSFQIAALRLHWIAEAEMFRGLSGQRFRRAAAIRWRPQRKLARLQDKSKLNRRKIADARGIGTPLRVTARSKPPQKK
jgi:hypothetical protein